MELVRSTFREATLYLKGLVEGLPRTTGLVQCFMGGEGADNFLALYELYVNSHRYQVRKERKRSYPYPGKCPLETSGASLEMEVGGGRIAVSWMDALAL